MTRRRVGFIFDNFPIEIKSIRFLGWLWFRFQWYKYVRKLNIVGFYDRIPIIATNYLEEDRKE